MLEDMRTVMSLEQFFERIRNEIPDYINRPTDAEVRVEEFYSDPNNPQTTIRVRSPRGILSPNLPLEKYYVEYSNGESFDNVLNHIASDFNAAMEIGKSFFTPNLDLSFESIKDKIDVQILDISINRDLLGDKIYTYLGDDFVAAYSVIHSEMLSGVYSIPITHSNFDLIGCSKEELHEAAFNNAEKMHPATFIDIETQLLKYSDNEGSDDLIEDTILAPGMNVNHESVMYVLSHTKLMNGSSAMWYKDTARTIGDLIEQDFYILPSSIHEMIILPKHQGKSAKELRQMVREVNKSLDPREVLSNKVLYYNRSLDKFYSVPRYGRKVS